MALFLMNSKLFFFEKWEWKLFKAGLSEECGCWRRLDAGSDNGRIHLGVRRRAKNEGRRAMANLGTGQYRVCSVQGRAVRLFVFGGEIEEKTEP